MYKWGQTPIYFQLLLTINSKHTTTYINRVSPLFTYFMKIPFITVLF